MEFTLVKIISIIFIIIIAKSFAFKINKTNIDSNNPMVQKVPKTIDILIILFKIITVVFLVVIISLVSGNKDNKFSNIIGLFSFVLFFIGFIFYLSYYVKNTSYEEQRDYFILKVRDKENKVYYDEISNFYFSENQIVIVTEDKKKVRINYIWFSPLILMAQLKKLLDTKFENWESYKKNSLLKKLNYIFEKVKRT